MTDKISKSIKPFQVLLSNTSKPQVFRSMIAEVVEFFKREGIDLTQFPITFDSWYGSDKLVELSGQNECSKKKALMLYWFILKATMSSR